jgi:hypothetical protein
MSIAHPNQGLWASSISPISPVEEWKRRGTQNGRDNARKRSGRLTRPIIALPEDIQAALRVQLRNLLVEDEGLAAEIGRLWQEAQQSGVTIIASDERSVAIGLDVTDSAIITGDQNAIKPQNVVKP